MELVFMKSDAVAHFKNNIDTLYTNYYVRPDNSWIEEEYPNAFEKFRYVEDFELADPEEYNPGELDIENCKRVYTALKFLNPSQASDERLWAGLCNSVFYDYLRKRWNNYELGKEKIENVKIRNRFFFEGSRSGLYGNSLARWWWIGKACYDPNLDNPFEKLDAIGAPDFSTKAFALFNSYTFSSNPVIMEGILQTFQYIREKEVDLLTKRHIRPAMKYLNAYGGSVLLDSLSSEEIRDILLKKLIELRYEKDESIDYSVDDSAEEIYEDESEEEQGVVLANREIPDELKELLNKKEDEVIVVSYGDDVKVVQLTGMNKTEMPLYSMPDSKEELSNTNTAILKTLLGRKLNERFHWIKYDYEIVEIIKK